MRDRYELLEGVIVSTDHKQSKLLLLLVLYGKEAFNDQRRNRKASFAFTGVISA